MRTYISLLRNTRICNQGFFSVFNLFFLRRYFKFNCITKSIVDSLSLQTSLIVTQTSSSNEGTTISTDQTTTEIPTTTTEMFTTTTEIPTTTENPANFPKEGSQNAISAMSRSNLFLTARIGGGDGGGHCLQWQYAALVQPQQRPQHCRHLGTTIRQVK